MSVLLASYPPLPIELKRAEGCELIDTGGKRYLDLYGGHCVCILGHNPPPLIEALNQQMQRITFYSTALGLPEREKAAQTLADYAPAGFGKVLFVNSGAEANENAIKLACAWTGASRIIAVEGAFHGRTAAADAVTGGAAREPHFPHRPTQVTHVPFGDVAALRAAIALPDTAAVILEPVQSMAGCRTHSKEFIAALNAGGKAHGVLVIADEVQGGFGRCEAHFSHQAVGIQADLITTAKGLGAGFPVGAVITRSSLGEAPAGLLGTTFGGGPLAVTTVQTVLREIQRPDFVANLEATANTLSSLADLSGVQELLGLGMLRGIRVGRNAKTIKSRLFERGYVVGGSNDPEVLRLMPPLTITPKQMQGFIDALDACLNEVAT